MPSTTSLPPAGWAITASRSAHPSSRPPASAVELDDGLYSAIATGMAAVAIPVECTDLAPCTEIHRELLLSTPAYEVWLMGWPAGSSIDAHAHDGIIAVSVVSGVLEETVVVDGRSLTRQLSGTTTVSLPVGARHVLRNASASTATTIHVHQRVLATSTTAGSAAPPHG